MNAPLQTLMQKEMTRKEFLATMGLAVASVLGFSSLIKLLTGKSLHSQFGMQHSGYGSSPYGR